MSSLPIFFKHPIFFSVNSSLRGALTCKLLFKCHYTKKLFISLCFFSSLCTENKPNLEIETWYIANRDLWRTVTPLVATL